MACSFHVDDAELLSELNELCTPEQLGQKISNLFLSPHVLNIDPLLLDALAYEMIASVDVLAPVMVNRILAQRNRGLVVGEELGLHGCFALELSDQPAEPHTVAGGRSCCNILCLT